MCAQLQLSEPWRASFFDAIDTFEGASGALIVIRTPDHDERPRDCVSYWVIYWAINRFTHFGK